MSPRGSSNELLPLTHVQLSQFPEGLLVPQHVADNWGSMHEQPVHPLQGERRRECVRKIAVDK